MEVHSLLQAVWQKGRVASGRDLESWRKDACGAWIAREDYGNCDSESGWEMDRLDPKGSDDLSTLRPLQQQNSSDKNDGRLMCKTTAVGGKGVVLRMKKDAVIHHG